MNEINLKRPDYEIFFSQVREDPSIELEVLTGEKVNCLIIGSGGCTAISMLQNSEITLDILDQSLDQIYLIKLKLLICQKFSKRTVLDFLEGRQNPISKYQEIKSDLDIDTRNYWDNRLFLIDEGINKIGKFERLFQELVKSNMDFERVFDRGYLTEIFGQSAVINSLNNEFYEHFKKILDIYRELYKPEDNYFYHQILHNSYGTGKDLPYYLKESDRPGNPRRYINDDFVNYIKNCTIQYDIIHTSNITDWMSQSEVEDFILAIKKRLNVSGKVIMRRLNGDLPLYPVLSRHFDQVDLKFDKSHFYSEVIVAWDNKSLKTSLIS